MLSGLEYKYFDCFHCNKHFPWRYHETVFPANLRDRPNPQKISRGLRHIRYLCEPCYYELLREDIHFSDSWDAVIKTVLRYYISVSIKVITKNESLCRVQLDLGRKRVTSQVNIMSPLREIKLGILDLVHELEVAKPHKAVGLTSFLRWLGF